MITPRDDRIESTKDAMLVIAYWVLLPAAAVIGSLGAHVVAYGLFIGGVVCCTMYGKSLNERRGDRTIGLPFEVANPMVIGRAAQWLRGGVPRNP
jgi:hypothetical protein